METIKLKIYKEEWLSDALKRDGIESKRKNPEFIPSNIILDKTLPGLGATHMELHSGRPSIIIEPNVPVILGKAEGNKNWLAVWEKCTPKQVEKYLTSTVKDKKLICTPESFSKIRKAANNLGINIYKDYFCLMDECEKYIQDVDYRTRITQPVYDFFKFDRKALVSATPLPMTHPKLEEQGFTIWKVMPEYDYKKDLELIVTNSYDATVRRKLESLVDSPCICIFLNSTDGINKIIHSLQLTDYRVFCSKKSENKLKERDFENVSENLELPLAKYNFFTCRFFSALDIKLPVKPDILMLTDLNEAKHSIIDPFTEAIQIYGRFRNKFENDRTFNSFTHITNVSQQLPVKSHEDVMGMIGEFEITHQSLKQRHETATDKYRKQAIWEDIKNVRYADLLDENGEINYFSVDNLYNEERVKAYYLSGVSLLNAYKATNHFNITYSPAIEPVSGDTLLILRKAKSATEKRKILTEQLEKLYQSYEDNSTINLEFFLEILSKEDEGEYMIEAYQKIGKLGIETASYRKTDIDKIVQKYDKEVLRFLPKVLADIKAEFELNVPIEKEIIKARIEGIYGKHKIQYTVKLKTIEDYYFTKESHSSKPYKYTLTHKRADLDWPE